MATLVSPGASVTVQNDSFYAASGSGSVPLVIFATAQDKLVPGSTTSVAEGTKKENAGKLYLMTSQRDALQAFGMPIFQENAGTVVQGDELNEYGLHAMFSALGITNRAYALRANIDLNALAPTQVEPRGAPLNQTIWFDTASTDFGIFEKISTASANDILNWKKVNVLVPELSQVNIVDGKPLDTLGVIGDYAVVPYLHTPGSNVSIISVQATTNPKINVVYRKTKTGGNIWEQVTPSYQSMTPVTGAAVGTVWVKLDQPAGGMNSKFKRFAAGEWSALTTVSGSTIMDVEAKMQSALRAGSYAFIGNNHYYYQRASDEPTRYTVPALVANEAVTIKYTSGSSYGVQTLTHTFSTPAALANAINTSTPLAASVSTDIVTITSLDGRLFSVNSKDSSYNWMPTKYTVSSTAPTVAAPADTLWYDDSLYADIMINDGARWRGLQSTGGRVVTNSAALLDSVTVQIRQSEPLAKPTGSDLTYGDIWIDPVDATNQEFYQYTGKEWLKLDQTDQSTTYGVLFADARASDEAGVGYYTSDASTASAALLVSDYVDPTCPDPRLYPRGMVMVNLAQTGGVVRKFVTDAFADIKFNDTNGDAIAEEYYIGDVDAYPVSEIGPRGALQLASVANSKRGRWVTASGVGIDGSGVFGRNAQRILIVNSLASSIISNDDLRAETIEFNIAVAPGYPELLDEMITLNVDRKETSYIITDVPARLAPQATAINEWATNKNNAPSNGEKGRTSRYDYAAQYMGWCLGTNVNGKEVCIPGSTVALRTYLFNDSVSYVWFPPAGTERGVVTNAASVGYINAEGEYAPVIYNQGQRDTMYLNNINPIALRPNRGLIVFGDKSLAPIETALDRVNVGRLVVYIRTQIAKISERFLFKLNTPRVQEEFAGALTSFLANIMLLEGLEDFAVVCDSSNNTAARRQRNELWADIAIVPTKSINFVYVPVRIQNASN